MGLGIGLGTGVGSGVGAGAGASAGAAGVAAAAGAFAAVGQMTLEFKSKNSIPLRLKEGHFLEDFKEIEEICRESDRIS